MGQGITTSLIWDEYMAQEMNQAIFELQALVVC